MAKKVWIDTLVANKLGERLISILDQLFEEGYTGVMAETAIDIKSFRENQGWVEDKLAEDQLVMEAFYDSFDELTQKAFTWSSYGITTEPAKRFEVAVMSLPDSDELIDYRYLLEDYSIEREAWCDGRPAYQGPKKLSVEAQKILKLTEDATRTEVLKAAETMKKMELFEQFNMGYVEGLARQHDCDYILSMNGATKL